MKNLKSKYYLFPLVIVAACGSGLSISVYRGNHETQRIERKVKVNGRTGTQYIPASDPRFDQFQCLADGEMWKVQELYNRAKRAGVKMDDL